MRRATPSVYLDLREPRVQWRSQAGAHALATGGCAPPVQGLPEIIGAECTVINRALKVRKGVEIELCSLAVYIE